MTVSWTFSSVMTARYGLRHDLVGHVKSIRGLPTLSTLALHFPSDPWLREYDCRQNRHWTGRACHGIFQVLQYGIGKRHWQPRIDLSYGHRDIWNYFHFYDIFVKYFVHGLWSLCLATQAPVVIPFEEKKPKSLRYLKINYIHTKILTYVIDFNSLSTDVPLIELIADIMHFMV